ncbi:MAG: DUF72 domain-containing protein [Promethearchaeota archaeon]
MPRLLIGTSGWGYDEWVGPFYPCWLRKEDFLHYYSEVFYTTEVNTTFYHIPSYRVVDGWVQRTPLDFKFSVKLPRTITHEAKLDLNECSDDLRRFLSVMKPLLDSDKFLAFLIQLPPSFRQDEHFDNLVRFIDEWPIDISSEGSNLVVEFRHESWMRDDVFDFLRREGVSYCMVVEPLLPLKMEVTNKSLAYVRFHGFGKKIWFDYYFKEEEIRDWALQLRSGVLGKADKICIYFNNHFSGYAAKNALMMIKELGGVLRRDPKDITSLDIDKRAGRLSSGQTSLDRFFKVS